MKKKFLILIFLYLFNIINSTPSISANINIEEISSQKCFSAQNNQAIEKTIIYQINNNGNSSTIFIQYKSVSSIIISDSINENSQVLFKDSENLGSYYLNMLPSKNVYYITITPKNEDYKICFESFPNLGKQFEPKEKSNIKVASFDMISCANLTYYIENCKLKQSNIFYTVRFEQKILDKINMPKMILGAYFINSQRQQEFINIDKWYFKNNYYYAPFYVPKSNYTEKFTKIVLCLTFELKQELQKDESIKFDLELIDSQEITHEFNLNLNPNNDINKILYPKVYFINIYKNIFEFDRDILLLQQDSENKYITPFFSPNININNNNSIFIQKNLIDINKNTFLNQEKENNYLLLLILDEKNCEIKENENVFISFRFYGGYHDLLHYQEEMTIQKFFNDDKNKISIKMPHCRSQYFINYFKQNSENENDERILDIESSIGNMNLFYMNQLKGKNLDEYFNNLGQNCVNKFENSLLTGNFGALKISCPDNKPVLSNIYAHKKNSKEDTINFLDQKSLIYIEYNTQYSLKFNSQENQNEFNFRIKILRTNINIKEEDYKIEITYNNQNLNLDKENCAQIFKHEKNSESNILIKINSNNSNEDLKNKGFILEIFKSIDILEDNIIYIEKETKQEKNDLDANKVAIFIYDKNEINSAFNKIELFNTYNDNTTKIKICVSSGKGKYPYMVKPLCNDEEENIIINPGESFVLDYNNPYINNNYDENDQFYIIICSDKNLKYSYNYERKIKIEQDKYENINHKGNKIFKLLSEKHDKKSMYYQINVCENKNNNLYYTINNSEKIPIKNDIYQECSLDQIKSFLVEFEGDGTQTAKFKYYYGSDKLLQKIEKFSKEICLSKSDDNNHLLIKFQTPFVQQIDVKIILVQGVTEKYKNYCEFEKFCKENYDSKNIKLIEKKVIVKGDKAEACINIKEIEELLNKDVDIYLITKSLGNNLEIFYDVKSLNLNLDKLNDSENRENDENKNYICINCGEKEEEQKEEKKEEPKEEQKEVENINNEKEEEDKDDKDDKDEKEEEDKNEKKEKNKDEQKNNDVDQPLINQVPINVNNNNNDNDNKEKKDDTKKIRQTDDDVDNNKRYLPTKDDNNYNENDHNGKDRSKNHEDDRDGDVNNANDNGHENDDDNDHAPDNAHINNDNKNNSTNTNESNNEAQNNNQIVKEMRNDININNNGTVNNQNILKNKKDNNTSSLSGEGMNATVTKSKSRKLLYFILILIIAGIIYFIRNQYYNNPDNVNYSKISKYSYYDF